MITQSTIIHTVMYMVQMRVISTSRKLNVTFSSYKKRKLKRNKIDIYRPLERYLYK